MIYSYNTALASSHQLICPAEARYYLFKTHALVFKFCIAKEKLVARGNKSQVMEQISGDGTICKELIF